MNEKNKNELNFIQRADEQTYEDDTDEKTKDSIEYN